MCCFFRETDAMTCCLIFTLILSTNSDGQENMKVDDTV